MADPVLQLEHDHTGFSQAVAGLKSTVHLRSGRDDRALASAVQALCDELLVHFAREEEGLFPYVVERFPDVAPAIERLLAGHDVVCGCLVRLAHALGRDGELPTSPGAAAGLFDRFEQAYADHARAEIALLRELDARLSKEQRQEIAALVEGL